MIPGNYTHWGSRLSTPKWRALLKDTININAEIISTRKTTYWPTDQNKIPDLLDFFVMKSISSNYVEIIEFIELTSDHIPVILTLSSKLKENSTICRLLIRNRLGPLQS